MPHAFLARQILDPENKLVEGYEFHIEYLETDELWEGDEETATTDQLISVVRLLQTFFAGSVEVGSYHMKMYLDEKNLPPAMAETDLKAFDSTAALPQALPPPDRDFAEALVDSDGVSLGFDEVNIGVIVMPYHKLLIRAMTQSAIQESTVEDIAAAAAAENEEEEEEEEEEVEEEGDERSPKRARNASQNASQTASSSYGTRAPSAGNDHDVATSQSPSKCSVVMDPIVQDITSCCSNVLPEKPMPLAIEKEFAMPPPPKPASVCAT